jgi:enoyl-CoA hydratase
MDESSYTEFRVSRDGRLVTVTLDRPQSLNAISRQAHTDLERFWYEVANDPTVGAIILTGVGRAFCAGADMRAVDNPTSSSSDSRTGVARSFVHAKRIIAGMLEVEQPIIGAINGDAVGLGASLAFACDIIVANETARFADTHVKNMAVVAGDGGTVVWPLMMSIHKAKEYLLLGDFLVAADAARLGIINYAVPADEVMPKATELAQRCADGPPWALRWTKTSLNKILRDRLNLTMDTALATEWLTFATEDHREAVQAFSEKRKPRYTGR